jgi:hypothetical protein
MKTLRDFVLWRLKRHIVGHVRKRKGMSPYASQENPFIGSTS